MTRNQFLTDANAYLEAISPNYAKSTMDEKSRKLRYYARVFYTLHLDGRIRTNAPSKLTADDLHTYVTFRRSRGVKDSTIAKDLSIIGMFLSRMAKGRTLRQFILVNVLAPSIFCMVWIAIFGGVAINMQVSGSFDIWNAVNTNGMEATIFFILDSFPLGKVLIVVFLVAICTSFSTLADPMAAACATMSVHGLSVDDEAPKKVKILIGVIMGAIAYILVASGGIGSVKGMWVIIGLPIAFVQMIVIISAFRNGNKALKNKDYMIPDDIK